MLNKSSGTAQRMLGTYVEDAAPPPHPVLHWMQNECRSGILSETVRKFAEAQEEELVAERVRVLRITEEAVVLSIPTKLFDHESRSALETEVFLELNPYTAEAKRRLLV